MRTSLRTKLLLAIAVLYLPVFALLILDFWITYQGRIEAALEGQRTAATFLSLGVDFTLDEAVSAAESYSMDNEVQTMNAERIHAYLAEQARLYPQYDDLAVVDAQGQGVASAQTPPGSTVNVADRDYFQQVMATGKPAVSNVITSRGTGRPIIVAAAPILDSDNRPKGIFAASLTASFLAQRMTAAPLPLHQDVCLVDHSGRVAFSLGPQNIEGITVVDYPPVAQALNGSPFLGIVFVSLFGDERAVATVASPKYGWVVCVSNPTSTIRADILPPLLVRFASYLALAAIAAVGATVLTRRLILKPLDTLIRGLVAFGRGGPPPRIDVRTGDELQIAAETFNRMAEEIRAREQQREDFIQAVSHDLRSPLAAMLGQAQLIQRSPDKPDRVRSLADFIVTSARRMNAMIQDLVESARLEAGEVPLRRQAVNLAAFVSELLERAGGALEVGRIRVDIQADLPPVNADPDRLERILINLLTNALKYSEPGTKVRLSARKEGDEALVSVANGGPGIAPEDLPHIFERYYRGGAQGKEEGLGLGLYITKMLVEAPGGRIWVESESGQGAVFYFTLPLA